MTTTTLFKVDDFWAGTLFLSARPRGDDWLDDEIAEWEKHDIDEVVSLLTDEEGRDLKLENESVKVRNHGMSFTSFPIPDRQVPASTEDFSVLLNAIERLLETGHNVLVHCRQGVGRTGLVAACLLAKHGVQIESALKFLSQIRGVKIPETLEQKAWVFQFAAGLNVAAA